MHIYIDDIVIFSNTFKEYLEYLEVILKLLNKNQLKITTNKSFIGYNAVKLLRYIIDGDSLRRI